MRAKDLVTRLSESKEALRVAEAKAAKSKTQAKAAWDHVQQVKRKRKELKKAVKEARKAARRTAKKAEEQVKASRKALKVARKQVAKLERSLGERPAEATGKKGAKHLPRTATAKELSPRKSWTAPNSPVSVSAQNK